ncbi:MAG: hypothetical protein LBC19_02655 [Tannerella sp.]|jgi:hypothetical protein|nr:hypothetical protein [Tannerella sp.]
MTSDKQSTESYFPFQQVMENNEIPEEAMPLPDAHQRYRLLLITLWPDTHITATKRRLAGVLRIALITGRYET